MPTRIAYFTNQYPAISHGFIRRELLAVERRGLEVVRVALRGWDGKIYDDQDVRERAETRYVLQGGPLPLARSMARALVRSPRRFVEALGMAVKLGTKSVRPIPYHLVYFAEACVVAEWLEERGVEHVHAHFATNATEVVMLARMLGGPPYSFTVHGPEEFNNIEYYGFEEKIARAAFVVAITHFTKSQLCRTVPFELWSRFHVLRCGLDPEEFFSTPPGPVPTEPRLVCIGRLVEQKGQQILVEAAARLRDRGQRFSLVIVGGGPMEADLRRLIERFRLEEHVTLTGAVSTERLHEELRKARGLVMPSFAEGLPMVIMESMALGRPVIATYVAGIPELVRPGENGWLVPAGAVEPLVDAMQDLLTQPADAIDAMARAGFEAVKSLHSAATLAAGLVELFEESARRERAEAAPRLKEVPAP
jgi:colanic acid/amylovoran biosynthesis glycosyltransferase